MKAILNNSGAIAVNAERVTRARSVFEVVSAQNECARAESLQRECHGDQELRTLVEQMLAADSEVQPILDLPQGLASSGKAGALRVGDQVGPYRVLREIGVGGMGAVYQAELASSIGGGFVAIKVLRWYSHEISKRFQQEQQILSALQHPNIARLLDTGTIGGVTDHHSPYFVMEYVEGVPIHFYCEREKLSIRDRILLFKKVCAAVVYLHQNLVVHRDLKPGNVLVTQDGTVKLVDFGIAKLLQPAGGLLSPVNTIAGLMTPDYASPEQIRGGATSTLTDVYSLGVLLYELLTEERPFTAPVEQIHETLRRICEEEPRRPSLAGKRQKQLRGELDNIILKALRKDPERRYASVEQFAEDLRRYLGRHPVLAQGDSLFYRLRKFATRHAGGAAAGLGMLLLLAGGIVATNTEARIAREERARAEWQASQAEEARHRAENQQFVAEEQRAEANAQRALAEKHARVAELERANAERRLSALQTLANGVVRVYDAKATGEDASTLFAENVRDSLLALRQEPRLAPGLADALDRTLVTMPQKPSSDSTWQVPEGWTAMESEKHQYHVGRDLRIVHGGKSSLVVRARVERPMGKVTVAQQFSSRGFQGKRVRLTAFLRGEGVEQAMVGLNGGYSTGLLTIAGTRSWKKYELVVDVAASAQSVGIWLCVEGAGTLWADDLTFEIVSTAVPLSMRQPANLNFTVTKK